MKAIVRTVKSLLRDSQGATAIEYAIIASLISVSFVTAATSLGPVLAGLYETVAAKF